MELYSLLEKYARERNLPYDPYSAIPHLGRSLALFHNCLIEAGMRNEQILGFHQIIDPPQALTVAHLSRFIIGHLSKSSDSLMSEDNAILFDLYSFFSWLEKKKIPHGLDTLDFQHVVREISVHRDRCRQVIELINSLTANEFEEPPTIYSTWHDVFAVMRILSDAINIQGQKRKEPLRIFLSMDILRCIRIHDRMEMTLGNTANGWIIIEGNEIFPGYSPNNNRLSN